MKVCDSLILGSYELPRELFHKLDYEWIDTAISYDNGFLIPKNKKVISKFNPDFLGTDESYWEQAYEFMMSNHLKELRRDSIEVMLVHNSDIVESANWLFSRMLRDSRIEMTGVSNFNKDALLQLEILPEINEIEYNPEYVDHETLLFMQLNEIVPISYGVFGGKYNSHRFHRKYAMNGLMKFQHMLPNNSFIVKPDNELQWLENRLVYESSKDHDCYLTFGNKDKSIEPYEYEVPNIIKMSDYNSVDLFGEERVNVVNYDYSNRVTLDYNVPNALRWLTDFRVYLRYQLHGEALPDGSILSSDGRRFTIDLVKEGKFTKVMDEFTELLIREIK